MATNENLASNSLTRIHTLIAFSANKMATNEIQFPIPNLLSQTLIATIANKMATNDIPDGDCYLNRVTWLDNHRSDIIRCQHLLLFRYTVRVQHWTRVDHWSIEDNLNVSVRILRCRVKTIYMAISLQTCRFLQATRRAQASMVCG